MQNLRKIAKPVAHLVVICMLGMTAFIPAAQAAMVSTEAVVSAKQLNVERERIRSLFGRDDVKAELISQGVDPAQASKRVDSLTDKEVHSIAGQLDELPAGAGAVEVILIVLLVLVITDLLGITNVFSFLKKQS